jgi:hypothetical protein
MSKPPSIQHKQEDNQEILNEVRDAYGQLGIELAENATYGVYRHLRCKGCGTLLGIVGDKLLPGMISKLLAQSRELYVKGLLGCACGHQARCARQLADENGKPAGSGSR